MDSDLAKITCLSFGWVSLIFAVALAQAGRPVWCLLMVLVTMALWHVGTE
jgi:hypothetical protein